MRAPEHPKRPRSRRPLPRRPAETAVRPVSDDEYLRLYEKELRRYVERFGPTPSMGPGDAYLSTGRWAWIEGGAKAVARWARYATQHRGLKVMDPDGTWRPWNPLSIR